MGEMWFTLCHQVQVIKMIYTILSIIRYKNHFFFSSFLALRSISSVARSQTMRHTELQMMNDIIVAVELCESIWKLISVRRIRHEISTFGWNCCWSDATYSPDGKVRLCLKISTNHMDTHRMYIEHQLYWEKQNWLTLNLKYLNTITLI